MNFFVTAALQTLPTWPDSRCTQNLTRNAHRYNLTGSTGSPALVAKSPTKSPVVRPVSSALATGPAGRNSIGGLLSPQYGPVQTRRPSTAPSHAATASSAPIQPVEDLTFRRRFHPEGAKQQQQSAVSPALLASRRRSSNLPSPLLLARNQTSPPSARRVSSSSSSSESSPVPASSNKPQTAAQASLSRLLHGTKSPSFGAKSPSSATLKAQASSSRKLLPLNSTHHIISAPSSNAQHFGSRRVSEPLSPYYSPSIRSPSSGDIFASAFAGKPSSYSPSHRRPSISASWSAPVIPDSSPLASSVATTRPQDYSGFAGFLESKHANRASPTVSPTTTLAATKHRGSDGTESGYDAQDEQLSLQKDRRLASSTNKKAVSPVTSRRALAEVSNGLREAQQKSHASIMKERLANLHNGANGSSASSSSSDGSNAPSKVKGYHFSRGGAFKGSLHDEEQEDEEDESSRRGRRSRQSTVKATQQQQATSTAQSNSRTRQSSATAVQDADYVVTVLPSNKHSSSATAKPESAVLTSSSSSSSSEEEENARGRGRAVRTTSSDYTERRQLVSPFTALERAAAGLPHQQPPPARPASRQAPLERGRSMQRSR